MKLGFTGTREQPTVDQLIKLQVWLVNPDAITEFHHGCCVGSDEAAHNIAKVTLGEDKIHLHPPDNKKLEMKYTLWEYSSCIWHPRKDYLLRNMDIVNDTDRIIAFAKFGTNLNTIGSGTWATVRYAVAKKKRVDVFYPSGKLVKY